MLHWMGDPQEGQGRALILVLVDLELGVEFSQFVEGENSRGYCHYYEGSWKVCGLGRKINGFVSCRELM